jgi:hypothetical protein
MYNLTIHNLVKKGGDKMKKSLLILTLLTVVITSTVLLDDKIFASRIDQEYNPAKIQQDQEFTPAKPGDENVSAVNKAVINGDIQYATPTDKPSIK